MQNAIPHHLIRVVYCFTYILIECSCYVAVAAALDGMVGLCKLWAEYRCSDYWVFVGPNIVVPATGMSPMLPYREK